MRRTWGVAALLLALGAGAAFYSILWKLYAGQVLDYGAAPFTIGWFEGTVYYWFGGFGLLATVGLTLGLTLLFPNGFRIPGGSLAMIPLVVALALAGKFFVLQRAPTSDEENVYHFTAQLLSHGRLVLNADLPPELLGPRWGWIQQGSSWAGIYPYGWPLLLAIGYLLRVPWLLTPLLAGLALWFAGEIARRAYGARVAALTLIFLGTAPFFVLTAATDAASPAAAAAVLAAVLCVMRYVDDDHEKWLWLCGTAGGVALLTKPLIAVALLAPWLAMLLSRRKLIPWAVPMAAAAILLFAINATVTGSAFGASPFGFGQDARAVGGAGVHTLSLGILNDAVNLLRLNHWLLGWPLSLLLVCCAPWTRWTKLIFTGVTIHLALATASPAPGMTVTGPPDYFEAGCLLVILAAAALDRLSRWPGVPALTVAILVVNLALFTPLQVRSLRAMSNGSGLLSKTLHERVTSPAVVFVQNVQPQYSPTATIKSAVFFAPLNASVDDPVFLANSRGADQDRAAWKKHFANRRAYRYQVGADWKPVLEELR